MVWFLIIGILFIIVEVLTPTIFFFLAFGIAFILNSLVFELTKNLSLSLITTAITTFIVFYFIKKINLFKTHNNYKSNLSNYEGKTCVVEEVLPNNIYRIKIFSEIWTAKSDEILLKGDVCKVSGRLDNTLIIKKQ